MIARIPFADTTPSSPERRGTAAVPNPGRFAAPGVVVLEPVSDACGVVRLLPRRELGDAQQRQSEGWEIREVERRIAATLAPRCIYAPVRV